MTPHHYNKPIQPWDYIAANELGFFEGNIIKYVTRWKEKNGIEDLKKAKHYIEKLIELQNDIPPPNYTPTSPITPNPPKYTPIELQEDF
jgi:hypothetical protein